MKTSLPYIHLPRRTPATAAEALAFVTIDNLRCEFNEYKRKTNWMAVFIFTLGVVVGIIIAPWTQS